MKVCHFVLDVAVTKYVIPGVQRETSNEIVSILLCLI